MAMREAVAVDFMGVGTSRRSLKAPDTIAPGGESQRVVAAGRLVKPIPNGRRIASPGASEAGDSSTTTHPFASPSNLHGLRKQPWNRLHAAGRFSPSEDDGHSGVMAVVSPKRERASPDAPHHSTPLQSDNSAPASPSHTPAGEFWRMQQQPQARKAQTMYAGHQQAGAPKRTSPFRDEASQRGAEEQHNLIATQPQPPSTQAGAFGSPTPFHFQANGAAMAAKRSPFQNFPFQAGNLPGGHAVARPVSGGGKQQQPSTAQLTIFYAGMVNVYDDVPFDKAQAIMLLAGSGNTWSGSNYMNPPASGRNAFLKTPMAVPQSTPSTPGSPMAPTTSGQPPRPGVVFSNVRQPPVTNVELPQARKASLARFLEKRKDRVRKAPVNEEGEQAASASRDKSPERSAQTPAVVRTTRSPSPAVQDHLHRSSPPNCTGPRHPQRDGPPSCSEASSPPTRPPGTPPRQNMQLSESESKKSPTPLKRRDTAASDQTTTQQQHSNKRARSGRSSPHRLPVPENSSSL